MTPRFWIQLGLSERDQEKCIKALKARYRDSNLWDFEYQGGCSWTIEVEPTDQGSKDRSILVQIRPAIHSLDMSIARSAVEVYGGLAPRIEELDLDIGDQLCAYEMERLDGVPFKSVQPQTPIVDAETRRRQETLVLSFADIMAKTWNGSFSSTSHTSPNRITRADSPMSNSTSPLTPCTGKVGSSIISRLEALIANLPTASLRRQARRTLDKLRCMQSDYPVMLNHGDLLPSNILVDEDIWEITGLVDWAEAEILPFGTCLYALEHMLGYLDGGADVCEDAAVPPPPSASINPASSLNVNLEADVPTTNSTSHQIQPEWIYFPHASALRELFWARLRDTAIGFRDREAEAKTMRDLGVLLWYGFAWDSGKIDRVVDRRNDPVEVVCLKAFLGVG